ncbi:ATP-binding protein [Capnocytophaga gingivalis]|jgi:two-component system sensor histidine kinase|uniref:ATP-binding protein n=1 Tax=Capnocytophaga gingivalis TaxID=1017 RepID=UPI002B486D1B|nr:ATP-binding protein [Capnocytophaga gingivalis]MEB3013779.1 ATP-binding protein [Capnocytophaga gingivalis]
MESNELFFSVKAGIKNIVGKDLIADDNIAIFELVKNSYDAYASKVIITFEDNKIIIADDGKGMSIDDIEKKWLALAYSAKKNGDEDNGIDQIFLERRKSYRDIIQEKRKYAGAKGIGRFSCDRLGEELLLSTKKINTNTIEQLKIDWKDFEKQDDIDFSDIKIIHNSFHENETPTAFPNKAKSGTILEITKTSPWDRDKILGLKYSLEKLINPFSDDTNDEEFEIEIICKRELDKDKGKELDRDKVNGIVRNSILDIIKSKTTKIEVKVNYDKIDTKITDRGTLIYHISEDNKYKSLIDKLEIDIYYLNRTAKFNFTSKMRVEPVNYGSIFLFKNGFRVQPYGNKGDDSWGLDYRAQQGYNRYLGTRELLGQVSIFTDNIDEFREVSNREGGLVETVGFKSLKDIFEKAHRRLERYVVGVLWGEGFRKNKYFKLEEEVEKQRELLNQDKDTDEFEIVKNNIGSQLDFIQLLKGLANDKDIEIIDYNKNLINQLIDNKKDLNIVQHKFLDDLDKISDKLNDIELKNISNEIDKKIRELEEEKEEAKLRVILEEEKRIAAEQAKKEAEKRAKEAEIKANDLDDKLSIETQKNQYLTATRKTLSSDAEQLVHSIDLYMGNASSYINSLLADDNIDIDIKTKLYSIKNNIDKALKVAEIIIKSNFDYKFTNQRIDLPTYIKQYLDIIAISRNNINIKVQNIITKYILMNPIDIDIIIDNLISNSVKAKAKNILVNFRINNNNKLEIIYADDGIGVPEKLVKNPIAIFELGVRVSEEKGSGIGMYDVRKRLESIKGNIEFAGNNTILKGATFKITI